MSRAVTEASFDETVMAASTPVLVDFWAEWCGPCKQMNPVLEELSAEFEGRVEIVKVDVDENVALAQRYGVMSIPSFVYFKDGAEVARLVGARPASAMREMLNAQL